MTTTATEPIPGPRPTPIVGNLPDLANPDGLLHLLDLAKVYGPIYKLAVPGEEMILVSTRELVNELCEPGTAVDRALALAGRICENAPRAVQVTRDVVLGRLDPDTGEVIEYPIPHAENTMRDFFLDAQGRMWFGSPANDRVGYFYLKEK